MYQQTVAIIEMPTVQFWFILTPRTTICLHSRLVPCQYEVRKQTDREIKLPQQLGKVV
jgi:hypothetical protein